MTEGPYYVVGELIRQNITEGQAGAALHLNMGFLDVETCQPVPNVYVEFWHANSTVSLVHCSDMRCTNIG